MFSYKVLFTLNNNCHTYNQICTWCIFRGNYFQLKCLKGVAASVCKSLMMMINYFVLWLTNERHLALFPAGTIVRDPHHRESLSSRYALSRVWTCAEPEFRVSWMKLCSSDNHYTTTPQKFYSVNYRIIINLNGFWEFWRKISPVLDLPIHPIYAYPPI